MTSAKFSGFWTPSPPLVSMLGQSIVLKSRNLAYCIRIWATPSPPSHLTPFVNGPQTKNCFLTNHFTSQIGRDAVQVCGVPLSGERT